MSGEGPSSVASKLYHKLAESDLLPDFLSGEQGESFFSVIFFSWIIISGLVLISFLVSSRLKKIPRRLQGVLEITVESLANLLDSLIGPGGRKYLPLLGTIFIYIFCLNLLGLIPGLLSPTANLNSTFAIAIPTVFLIQVYGIKEHGFMGYLKHMAGSPKGIALWSMAWLFFVVHLIGELAKVLSLSLRLFCNIHGEDTVIHSLATLGIPYLPLLLMMMILAVFTAFLQSFIFTALSCIYIMTLTSHGDEH